MAFWGVELLPGRPYVHMYSSSLGRLRISQATLIDQTTGEFVGVLCKIGNQTPLSLCSINEGSLNLNIELEEKEDAVVFEVVGSRIVHLTGFYFGLHGLSGNDLTETLPKEIRQIQREVCHRLYQRTKDCSNLAEVLYRLGIWAPEPNNKEELHLTTVKALHMLCPERFTNHTMLEQVEALEKTAIIRVWKDVEFGTGERQELQVTPAAGQSVGGGGQ